MSIRKRDETQSFRAEGDQKASFPVMDSISIYDRADLLVCQIYLLTRTQT
jgi:hypothetical protein